MPDTYYDRIRLLVGDLDEPAVIDDDQVDALVSYRTFTRDELQQVSLLEVAIDYCNILASYHSDERPRRAGEARIRADQLDRQRGTPWRRPTSSQRRMYRGRRRCRPWRPTPRTPTRITCR